MEGGQRPRFKFLAQLSLQQKLPSVFGLYRNPPSDHWALASGLPTYVAQNGLVSNTTLKQENFKSGGRVKGFQFKSGGKYDEKWGCLKARFSHFSIHLRVGPRR